MALAVVTAEIKTVDLNATTSVAVSGVVIGGSDTGLLVGIAGSAAI